VAVAVELIFFQVVLEEMVVPVAVEHRLTTLVDHDLQLLQFPVKQLQYKDLMGAWEPLLRCMALVVAVALVRLVEMERLLLVVMEELDH